MKTKYILHGGFTPGEKQENDEFTKEILKDTPEKVHILLVYFAKELDRIPKSRDEDLHQFNSHKGNKEITFEIASEEGFIEQVKGADIIYLHGGTTVKILEGLKKFSNLRELFQGKIVAGDSAGANALSSFCYSQSGGGVVQGLGVLPLKVFCHYKDEHKDELDKVSGDLETVLLPEYKYKVFEV